MARAGLTTARLVEAGADLADREGFESVTATALARLFDVRVASLYAHIENTHDLLTRIALLALDRLANRAADAVAGLAGRDALVALANVHRDFALAHPGLFSASRYPLDSAAAASSGGARISRLTRAVLHGYGLGETEETHAIRLLGSLFLGFTTLEQAGNFSHSTPDPHLSWLRTLDAMDAILKAWPRPAGTTP